MTTEAEQTPDQDSAGRDDWASAHEFLTKDPTQWRSFSWIAARSLIDSVNDILARGTRALVTDLRGHWVGKRESDPRICEHDVARFLVAGDPGEQDASQYVVGRALSRAANGQEGGAAGFVLLLSDVIYPSGNVNDYVDGFYKPYRADTVPSLEFGEPEEFSIQAPIYAIPGNHDWYDGLYGFAYHFLPRPGGDGLDWPDLTMAPRFDINLSWWRRVLDRFCRTLWRVPSAPLPSTVGARQGTPHTGQPGPYFVIETEHLDLVCLDTGTDGRVDDTQMEWLERVSGRPARPKILMTGKPLVVNGKLVEKFARIHDLVTQDSHGYIATVGGDVHNFQWYRDPERPGLIHVVSGGAGAYTHASHPIRMTRPDARVPDSAGIEPEELFPGSAESLAYFAQQLVPSVWRMLRTTVLFGAGIALGWWTVRAEWSVTGDVAGEALTAGSGVLATAVLLLAAAAHVGLTGGLARGVRHFLIGVEALCLGVVSYAFAHSQAPEDLELLLGLYLASALWLSLNGWGLRRSRWWSPARREDVKWWHHCGFLLGLVVSAGLALEGLELLGVWGSRDFRPWPVLVATLFGLLAIAGWWRRLVEDPSEGTRARRWLKHSWWLASVAQALVIIEVMRLELTAADRTVLFWSGFAGIALTIVIVLVMLGLPLLAAIPGLRLEPQAPAKRARWRFWSKGTRVLVLMAALPLLALWGWRADAGDDAVMKAAFALPAVLFGVVGLAVLTDWLRRHWKRAYKLLVLVPMVAVLLGLGTTLDVVVPPDLAGALRDLGAWWPVVVTASAAFSVLSIGAAVVLAHLVFVGAPRLLFDWGAHRSPRYRAPARDDEPLPFWSFIDKTDASRIVEAAQRATRADVGRTARRRAEIAFPGLNAPFGPIQSFVSEIYSRDEPPFFKHFLEFETTDEELTITLHKVRGDRPVETSTVARIDIGSQGSEPAEEATRAWTAGSPGHG